MRKGRPGPIGSAWGGRWALFGFLLWTSGRHGRIVGMDRATYLDTLADLSDAMRDGLAMVQLMGQLPQRRTMLAMARRGLVDLDTDTLTEKGRAMAGPMPSTSRLSGGRAS